MRVVVGSGNPIKLQATQAAFELVFPNISIQVIPCHAESGVSDQPMSDAETLQGAANRALYCRQAIPEADYWVGLEGGCQFVGQTLEAFAWMSVVSDHQQGQARTAAFLLPPAVTALIKQGFELGDADDQVFGKTNSTQSSGAAGLLTHDIIDRKAYYTHALVLALIPFMHPEFYPAQIP